MKKPKQTEAERIAAVNAAIAALQAKAKKLEAAKRSKDTRVLQRRAFLIGEAIEAEAPLAEPFKTYLTSVLDKRIKRPADRELLLDFLAAAQLASGEINKAS